jgi:uncharacterized protein (DUF488 family)
MAASAIYTIGYGGRDIETFIRLLNSFKVQYLVDVRSQPYSRYVPDYSIQLLEAHLNDSGIQYIFMGNTLGGRPKDPDCYVDNKIDYERVRNTPYFQAGLRRLRDAAKKELQLVLMCAERHPEDCHRALLIGRTLAEGGYDMLHIDESDQLISQADVMLRVIGHQPSLFGDDYTDFRMKQEIVRVEGKSGEQR